MKRSRISRVKPKSRPPEIRARDFDSEKNVPAKIRNLLSRNQQSRLRSIATILEYPRNRSIVFSEGEDARFVYCVVSGIVRISRHSENGRRQVLALMLPGDLFGIPDGGFYANSTETVGPTVLYRVPWQRLRDLMLQEPEMQMNLLMRVAFDLREAQRRIIILGQQNIAQRLVSFLLDFVQYLEFYNDRTRELTLPLTRFDLGDYLGTAPETVARAFSKLEKLGLVRRVSPRVIQIPDVNALRQLAGGRRRESLGK